MMYRILVDLVLFLLVILAPWWLSFLFAAVALFLFDSFYEVIFAGLFLDFLFAAPLDFFFGFQYFFTVISILLFILCGKLRQKIVFYPSKF